MADTIFFGRMFIPVATQTYIEESILHLEARGGSIS